MLGFSGELAARMEEKGDTKKSPVSSRASWKIGYLIMGGTDLRRDRCGLDGEVFRHVAGLSELLVCL